MCGVYKVVIDEKIVYVGRNSQEAVDIYNTGVETNNTSNMNTEYIYKDDNPPRPMSIREENAIPTGEASPIEMSSDGDKETDTLRTLLLKQQECITKLENIVGSLEEVLQPVLIPTSVEVEYGGVCVCVCGWTIITLYDRIRLN